jgi:hypothetical protein
VKAVPEAITIEAVIEKAQDSATCGIRIATADVVRWFGRKGRVAVVATIRSFRYRSSLSPMGGAHILPVNGQVRTAAKVSGGDRVRLTLEEDRAERTVEVPEDLAVALQRAKVRPAFDAMSFTHRKEWVRAIQDAKRPETRAKRIGECIAAMRERKAPKR